MSKRPASLAGISLLCVCALGAQTQSARRKVILDQDSVGPGGSNIQH